MTLIERARGRETPLLLYWAAVNAACRASGAPEPTYGPVRAFYERGHDPEAVAVEQAFAAKISGLARLSD